MTMLRELNAHMLLETAPGKWEKANEVISERDRLKQFCADALGFIQNNDSNSGRIISTLVSDLDGMLNCKASFRPKVTGNAKHGEVEEREEPPRSDELDEEVWQRACELDGLVRRTLRRNEGRDNDND